MSTAKTNKVKSSITPWNQVSYRAAPNEKNRPVHKNAVYLQFGGVLTDKTFSHSFFAPPLTTVHT